MESIQNFISTVPLEIGLSAQFILLLIYINNWGSGMIWTFLEVG